ncbi:Uncharacterised protein [Lysinibacillus capsici]|uniref:Uncharacterized protein n=1 Tax=Lysinibacillus capsici TaxID=2115968 RepID=A0A2X0XCI9_9BACI|nr:hypothetical protein [Lysinibacillus capsici]SPT95586.1 Uncharacterised protein [Lysinibacillus capsici]
MNAKEITVNYTYLKKLPDFENIRVEAGITITVEPGQDVDELFNKAYASMKKQVKNGLNKYTEAR